MDCKVIRITLLLFLFFTKVSALEFNGEFIQGHFIVGKTESGSKIYIDNKEIKVSKDGFFAFGLDRDRKYDVIIISKINGKSKKIVRKVKRIKQ